MQNSAFYVMKFYIFFFCEYSLGVKCLSSFYLSKKKHYVAIVMGQVEMIEATQKTVQGRHNDTFYSIQYKTISNAWKYGRFFK